MPAATHARLPAELKSLCSRLAVERLRADGWALAAELRRATLARLQAGESADELAEALQCEIDAAVVSQRRHALTLPPAGPL